MSRRDLFIGLIGARLWATQRRGLAAGTPFRSPKLPELLWQSYEADAAAIYDMLIKEEFCWIVDGPNSNKPDWREGLR